ncbi:leukocyte immunoglobulin-like receptor subfamily A member 6, partial [Terrapene carolina triunguis]|uniref:leukocyte immunoglobulin-like receptor subfamily A member 6 n=1 Tax=Terrapene triunguis TaxID=2587831 RepID=UPI00115646E1
GSYPKPSSSVSPGGVIPTGGNVTIRCWHQLLDMRSLLYKAGDGNYLTYTDPAGSEAEFPITSARREHGGSYTCRYSNRTGEVAYAEPSDPVQIIVAELPVPGPSISVSPSRVIAPGGAVTIRCQCRCEARRLLLYKGGIRIRELDAAGDGGEFTIPSARREDSVSYSCQSHSGSDPPNWSDPSDYVRIVVAELSYPKPSISLRPSEGVTLGGAVTIRCRGRHQNVRFLLYKDGNPNLLQDVEPAGDMAEFPIRNVSRRRGGNYRCSYRSKSDRPVQSEPSDPVELVVAGEEPGSASPLPAPHPGSLSDARFNPTAGTDPAGSPQLYQPPTELGGEAAPSGHLDFTHANITHLAVGAVVLLILGLILAEAYYSRPREVP